MPEVVRHDARPIQSAGQERGDSADLTVYGAPQWMTNMLLSTAALVHREPARTFADDNAHAAAVHLSDLLATRIREANDERCTSRADGSRGLGR